MTPQALASALLRADGGNDDAICKGPAKIGLRSAIAGKQS